MKKIVILAVLPLLLIAAVLGVLAVLDMGPLAPYYKKMMTAEAPPPPPPPPANRRIDIGSFVIPIVQGRGIQRQIGLDMVIEVNPASAEKVAGALPKLQSAFLFGLYEFLPSHSDPQSTADRQAIHDRLIAIGNGLFGEGAIRNVIFKAMYVRQGPS